VAPKRVERVSSVRTNEKRSVKKVEKLPSLIGSSSEKLQ